MVMFRFDACCFVICSPVIRGPESQGMIKVNGFADGSPAIALVHEVPAADVVMKNTVGTLIQIMVGWVGLSSTKCSIRSMNCPL